MRKGDEIEGAYASADEQVAIYETECVDNTRDGDDLVNDILMAYHFSPCKAELLNKFVQFDLHGNIIQIEGSLSAIKNIVYAEDF